jgi:hypothetical protein
VLFGDFRLSDASPGYASGMGLFHHDDPDEPPAPPSHEEALADHAMGIELQLLEITVRRDRSEAQGDHSEVLRLDAEADVLEAELGEVGLHLGAA